MKQSILPGFNRNLDQAGFDDRQDRRIVYYLGSKYRILPSIVSAISRVTLPGTKICDLFSGSGSVATALSERWDVITVDIQEYSRVLASALLNSVLSNNPDWGFVKEKAAESTLRLDLLTSLDSLLSLERDALHSARYGNPKKLADFIESGPLVLSPDETTKIGDTITRAQVDAKIALSEKGLDKGPDTVITRYYGGVYFTWQQAIDLDSLLSIIHEADPNIRDPLLASAFGAASASVNTIGKQFAQPIKLVSNTGKLKKNLFAQTVRDRSVDIFETFGIWQERLVQLKRGGRQYNSFRADFREVLANTKIDFDIVYADPPYTRDHYSRFYHILETMAVHDEPDISTTTIRSHGKQRASRGLYRTKRHQSPFSIKSQAESAFKELGSLVAARGVPMVLSYSPFISERGNRPRLLTIERIEDILQPYFSNIHLEPVGGFAHSKFNRQERNTTVDGHAEVILTCKP